MINYWLNKETPACERKWKRIEILSSNRFLIMKEDPALEQEFFLRYYLGMSLEQIRKLTTE